MEKNPILSIIIPTKDNEYIASRSIKAVAGLNLENVEIIVQDNSKTNALKQKLENLIENKQINYNYSDQKMDIIGNFNLSLSRARGEYICFIGDDDGIHPKILEVTIWAKTNGIKAIVPNLSAVYYWPGSLENYSCGCLRLSKFSGEFTSYNPQNELIRLLNNGCIDYLDYHLPKAYHGIVLKEKMEEIKYITGNYFSGLVPDMYGVTALSLILDEVLYIDFPLTISGISPKSYSGKTVINETNGPLEKAPHLKDRTDYNWAQNVPRIFSSETIWADTLMHALDDMKRSDLKNHFNPFKLHQRIWDTYKNLRVEIEEYYGGKPKIKFNLINYLLNGLKNKAKKISVIVNFYLKYKGIVTYKDLDDIESSILLILNTRDTKIKY